jgi:hypothetical protein
MVGQHVDLRAGFTAVDRVGPVSSPDRLRERHHAELIEVIVGEVRIDGGTVYPIFGLPQDDETSPTRSRRGTRATVSHNGAVGGAGGARTHDRRIMSPLL